jgi:hypothetical protein
MTDADRGADAAEPKVGDAIARALTAYRALADLGERVADEWQYVNDLLAVYSADLESLAAAAPTARAAPEAIRAVDVAIEEIGLITDPHRAIDWLSTFPQVVRLALTPPMPATT